MVGRTGRASPDWGDDRRRRLRRRLLAVVAASVALSVAFGIGREVVQNWGDTDGSLGDSIVDALAWASGAIGAGLIFALIGLRLTRE